MRILDEQRIVERKLSPGSLLLLAAVALLLLPNLRAAEPLPQNVPEQTAVAQNDPAPEKKEKPKEQRHPLPPGLAHLRDHQL